MNRQSVILLALIAAVTTIHAGEVTIAPVADTYFRGSQYPSKGFDTSRDGGANRLLVRSSANKNAPERRAQYAYIRFDLTGYKTIQDAVFSLTAVAPSFAFTSDQVWVYALPEKAGNTPQIWSEKKQTFDELGDEMANKVEDANPLNEDNLILVGKLSAGKAGDTVTMSGPKFDEFLNTRAGMSATLIVANRYDSNRAIVFNSREANEGGPTLTMKVE